MKNAIDSFNPIKHMWFLKEMSSKALLTQSLRYESHNFIKIIDKDVRKF